MMTWLEEYKVNSFKYPNKNVKFVLDYPVSNVVSIQERICKICGEYLTTFFTTQHPSGLFMKVHCIEETTIPIPENKSLKDVPITKSILCNLDFFICHKCESELLNRIYKENGL